MFHVFPHFARNHQSAPVGLSGMPEESLVCLDDPDGPAAEAFRMLGVRLRDMRQSGQLKSILITSSIPQEGKSTVSANLASVLAKNERQRVLLLEGDVRRPGLSKLFGLENAPGLCDLLAGKLTHRGCTTYLPSADLWIMPAGKALGNPLELLQSGKLIVLMTQLKESFDMVVVDSPPLLPLADTSIWMRLVDGVLLVTRTGTTAKRVLARGLELLPRSKLIAAVVNGSTNSAYSDYYYHPRN